MSPEQLRSWFHMHLAENRGSRTDQFYEIYLTGDERKQMQNAMNARHAFIVTHGVAPEDCHWTDGALPLEMSGMQWAPYKDNVYSKSLAYECRQPWLDKNARYTIVRHESPWVDWAATWWCGNTGSSLGNGGSSAELAALCKKHLDAMAAGAMKAAGVRA